MMNSKEVSLTDIDSNIIVMLIQSNREVYEALKEFTTQMKEQHKHNENMINELRERDRTNSWLIRTMLIVISVLAGVNVLEVV